MHRPSRKSSKYEFSFKKRFLFLGRNSGIHGLGHLFREDAIFFARLFWLLVLLVSAGCLYLLLMPVVERGDKVSYTADTLYLDWKTTFPAVTVCEKYDAKAARIRLAEFYPDIMTGQSFEFQSHMASLAHNRATSCRRGVCEPCGGIVKCDFPWRKAIERVHRSCEELLKNCSIRDEKFSCCTRFHLVDSEYGPCYSYNTLHGKQTNQPLYSLNITTGPGMLSFRVLSDVQVSVHSTEELSTNYLDDKLKFDVRPMLRQYNRVDYIFSLVEFYNDPMLANDATETRRCRYLHEVPEGPFDTYSVYSYGACRLARTTEHTFHHCACIHPVRDPSFEKMYCNFTGLTCLVEYEVQKIKLGLEDDDDDDDDPCLPSCLESELTTIHISRRWVTEESGLGSTVTVQMAGLPTVKFQRNVLRSELDLVVSVGGMVGLFFGASIFSLVEIFYLFLRKQ